MHPDYQRTEARGRTFKLQNPILFSGGLQPWRTLTGDFAPSPAVASMMGIEELQFLHHISRTKPGPSGAIVDMALPCSAVPHMLWRPVWSAADVPAGYTVTTCGASFPQPAPSCHRPACGLETTFPRISARTSLGFRTASSRVRAISRVGAGNLGGHRKSGHMWSLQNRPTGTLRIPSFLAHQRSLQQLIFVPPQHPLA